MIAILVTGVRVPGGALFLWFKCHIKMCAVKKKKRDLRPFEFPFQMSNCVAFNCASCQV